MTQNDSDLLKRIEKLEKKVSPQSISPFYSIWNFGIWAIVTLILIFVLATTYIRIQRLLEDDTPQVSPSSQSDIVLKRANEAIDSVDLVLSFLEGASVLLAVALSAATLYGLRQTKELREEFEEKATKTQTALNQQLETYEKSLASIQEELKQKSIDILNAQDYIERRKPQLDELSAIENRLKTSQNTLVETINDVSLLLQADQEFRLRNHTQAYKFVSQVLEHDNDDNPNHLALYMAGWLEIHHMPNKLDIGLERLKTLSETSTDWPSAKAAYGVALRRKAMAMKETNHSEARQLLDQAYGVLLQAVGKAPQLVDFNRESFWGPIGGILRDTQDYEGAIKAYERALKITPGSSYPQGNLANLYLYKTKQDIQFADKMFKAFEETLEFTRAELTQTPNDYFLVMDMAMSEAILGYSDGKHLEHAQEHLQQALKMDMSFELLNVSKRGWSFLKDSLPEGEDWSNVANTLNAALASIDKEIEKREN